MEWMILPLKRYAQFSGRSARKEFWMWVLFVIIVSIVLALIDKALGLGGAAGYGTESMSGPGMSGYRAGAGLRGGILTDIFSLAVLIPNIAVAVRRLHDTNRTGWWVLMPLVPYVIGAVMFFAVIFNGGAARGGAGVIIATLLMFVGFIGAIVLLVFYCMRGTVGPNKYGPDPLSPMGDLHETFS